MKMETKRRMTRASLWVVAAAAGASWAGIAGAAVVDCPVDSGLYEVDVTTQDVEPKNAVCWDYDSNPDGGPKDTTTDLDEDGTGVKDDGLLSIFEGMVLLGKSDEPGKGLFPDMLTVDPLPSGTVEPESGLFRLNNYDPSLQYLLVLKDGIDPKWTVFLLPAFFGYDNDDGEGFVMGLGAWAIPTKSLSHAELWGFKNSELPPVPLPAAVWLFGSGLLGLIAVGRRRKGSDAAAA